MTKNIWDLLYTIFCSTSSANYYLLISLSHSSFLNFRRTLQIGTAVHFDTSQCLILPSMAYETTTAEGITHNITLVSTPSECLISSVQFKLTLAIRLQILTSLYCSFWLSSGNFIAVFINHSWQAWL